MDPISPLHQDPLHGDATETPHQEAQRTCTRTSPCQHQGCLVCVTPTNHVRNLDEALSNSEATQVHPTTDKEPLLPAPPPDHPILFINAALKRAIRKKDIILLKSYVKQYIHQLDTNLEFTKYDCSDLHTSYLTAEDILTSHTALSTPLPNPPLPSHGAPNPSASFKPPKLVIDNWNGKAFDFYSWLASILHGFTLAQTDDPGRLYHTLHAIPLNKRGSLNHITDWNIFKAALIKEFGSISVFGREVNQLFELLPRYESVQEVAEDLAPKIMRLQSNLKTMEQFHKLEHLHSVAITQSMIQSIMKSLPTEVRSSFNEQFNSFKKQNPDHILAPNTFSFLAQFVIELKGHYQDNPNLYDLDLSPASIGVKATRPEPHKPNSKPQYSATTSKNRVMRPCSLCTIKGFQDDHFALGRLCGAAKLSSPDILKIITDNHLCPTCTLAHDPIYKCYTTYKDGRSKICTKGCMHGGSPVHHKACMHNNQAPFVTVGKVDVNKSVPLVEDIQVDKVTLGVQYDTGCQLSLISKSALSALPPSMYSLGTSSQIRVMTYAGEGSTILTTPVKLKLPGITLIL